MSTDAPPLYSSDILNPPGFTGPPGQLLPFIVSGQINEKFSILGSDSQVLQVLLQPGDSLCSEPGAMSYRGGGMEMRTQCGGCLPGIKRMIGGESFFRNTYTNKSPFPESIAVSPNYPAKIIPIDLSKAGVLHCKSGIYLAHYGDVEITFQLAPSLLAGCCGGSGLFLLKLSGTGTVFLLGGGTVMEKMLGNEEMLMIDHHALVGYSKGTNYGVRAVANCTTACCGGEGLFNAYVKGPGLVMVQTMSKTRLISELRVAAPRGGGGGGSAAAA
ncbi:tryptophan RNA-binding attenuator protein-like domain-containing protein [Globomyces pollinis-pini]|nr:tryptophan RNA-binding attenuator protein-like domain-containing protein [Globomyces pollinis-pini]